MKTDVFNERLKELETKLQRMQQRIDKNENDMSAVFKLLDALTELQKAPQQQK